MESLSASCRPSGLHITKKSFLFAFVILAVGLVEGFFHDVNPAGAGSSSAVDSGLATSSSVGLDGANESWLYDPGWLVKEPSLAAMTDDNCDSDIDEDSSCSTTGDSSPAAVFQDGHHQQLNRMLFPGEAVSHLHDPSWLIVEDLQSA